MSSRKGNRVILAVAGLAVLLLSVTGLALRLKMLMLESWHLRELEEGDPAERRNAIEKLVAMRSARSVPVFMNALAGADEDLRKAILAASQDIRSEAASMIFEVVTEARGRNGFELARRAARALTEIGSAKVVGATTRDPICRMEYADALVEAKRYEEALEQYVWCYGHGNESIGFGGVRNSFLLGDIVRLGALYPAALEFLRDRRDKLEATILAKVVKVSWFTKLTGGRDLFQEMRDFASINESLEEPRRTLALFVRLKDPDLRRLLLDDVLDLLLGERRYAEIVEAAGDVLTWLRRRISLEAAAARIEGQGLGGHSRTRIVEEGGKLYEAFLGAGRLEQANAIAEVLIKFECTAETHATLVRRAALAGDGARAQELLELASKLLPGPELRLVREGREHPERIPRTRSYRFRSAKRPRKATSAWEEGSLLRVE